MRISREFADFQAREPFDLVEQMEAINNPEDESAGTRTVPFSKVLYIEQDDFREDPPKQFFRLSPGREVRLRYGYFVKCTSVVKDATGNIVEVHCTYDPATRGGNAPDGRKVKATIHWVSTAHAVDIEARLYDRLFSAEIPGERTGEAFDDLNRDSLTVRHGKAEASMAEVPQGTVVQFERLGYFHHDAAQHGLFHRTVGLKDEWANVQKRA